MKSIVKAFRKWQVNDVYEIPNTLTDTVKYTDGTKASIEIGKVHKEHFHALCTFLINHPIANSVHLKNANDELVEEIAKKVLSDKRTRFIELRITSNPIQNKLPQVVTNRSLMILQLWLKENTTLKNLEIFSGCISQTEIETFYESLQKTGLKTIQINASIKSFTTLHIPETQLRLQHYNQNSPATPSNHVTPNTPGTPNFQERKYERLLANKKREESSSPFNYRK